MTHSVDSADPRTFHLHDSGMPDSVKIDTVTALQLEQARTRSLRFAVDSDQPGRGLQWTIDAVHPRAVAQVQSAHVAVCSNTDTLQTLPSGWHTDPTFGPGRNFAYFPEIGVVLFRERQGSNYRWVPFGYRATPDKVRVALELTIGSGPPIRPTVEGRLIVSKFGVVYVARRLQSGNLGWEQLVSPWPLWFEPTRMPRVSGLSADIVEPASVPAIAHLAATARLSQLMAASGEPALMSGTQALRTAVAALDTYVQNMIERMLMPASDMSPVITSGSGGYEPRLVPDPRPFALGSRMTTLVTALKAIVVATDNHPMLASDAHSQRLLAQLAECLRVLMVQGPDAVWVLKAIEERHRELEKHYALRTADYARTASSADHLTKATETAVHRVSEQIADLAANLPKFEKSMTRALQVYVSGVRGMTAVAAGLDALTQREIDGVQAALTSALARATVPFVSGSLPPEERAWWFIRALTERTTVLFKYVLELPAATDEQRRGVEIAVAALVLTVLYCRQQGGEDAYQTEQGPVVQIERAVLRTAQQTRHRVFLGALLATMTDSMLDIYNDITQYSEANYADVSLRHAHILFVRESLAVCQSLNARARTDTSLWTDEEWETFVADLHTLWRVAGGLPSAAALLDVRTVNPVRADLLQRALVLSASVVEPERPPVAGSLQMLEATANAAGLTRLDQLSELVSELEAAGVPPARRDTSTNARIVFDPSVDPRGGTLDVMQVELTTSRYPRVLYVGPSPLLDVVTALVHAATPTFQWSEVTVPPSERVWLPKPPDATLATQMLVAVVSETERAAWRSAAKQTAMGARDVLLSALKAPLKAYPWLAKKLKTMLESEYGEAALSYSLGLVLELSRSDARSLRLAKELRIEGEATALTEVLEPLRKLITEHMEQVLKVADDAVTAAAPDLPALEAPTASEPLFGAPEQSAAPAHVRERT